MLVVHHLEQSRSQRVLWLLEELDLKYTVKRYSRLASFQGPPELYKIHPLGKSPVIEDDGLVLAESGAIFQYLIKKHNKLGSESPEFLYWLHFAEGSLTMQLIAHNYVKMTKHPQMTAFMDKRVNEMLEFVDAHLQKHTFFVENRFTAADVMMSLPIEMAIARKFKVGPATMRWMRHMVQRPQYKKALAEGGDYFFSRVKL
ncbi:glutathione S-transferase domain-containing protein [Gorgonomyces haynaldii]|nr:glutathione S-transferase domain-containing protein [Gorgonomyces haynaldii]